MEIELETKLEAKRQDQRQRVTPRRMKFKTRINAALCSLHRMVRHIRVLGILRGLQYWRIENACRRDPDMIIRWAVRCEHEAARCIMRGDRHGEAMMAGWAVELRASHRRYVPNKVISKSHEI